MTIDMDFILNPPGVFSCGYGMQAAAYFTGGQPRELALLPPPSVDSYRALYGPPLRQSAPRLIAIAEQMARERADSAYFMAIPSPSIRRIIENVLGSGRMAVAFGENSAYSRVVLPKPQLAGVFALSQRVLFDMAWLPLEGPFAGSTTKVRFRRLLEHLVANFGDHDGVAKKYLSEIVRAAFMFIYDPTVPAARAHEIGLELQEVYEMHSHRMKTRLEVLFIEVLMAAEFDEVIKVAPYEMRMATHKAFGLILKERLGAGAKPVSVKQTAPLPPIKRPLPEKADTKPGKSIKNDVPALSYAAQLLDMTVPIPEKRGEGFPVLPAESGREKQFVYALAVDKMRECGIHGLGTRAARNFAKRGVLFDVLTGLSFSRCRTSREIIDAINEFCMGRTYIGMQNFFLFQLNDLNEIEIVTD